MFIYTGVNSKLDNDHLVSLRHTEKIDRIEQINYIQMPIYNMQKEMLISRINCH